LIGYFDVMAPKPTGNRRAAFKLASPLLVQGIGQAIAIHLARNYAVKSEELRSGSPSLPGYKLRQITDWMVEHVADDLNLDRLATQAGLSKFHFHRLFKSAMGVSPAHYHIDLRMDVARRLLRETKKSVVEVALDVGYANPSHFAKLFRRQTGLSPSDYGRQR
jgi:AraC family transcriptional regulator